MTPTEAQNAWKWGADYVKIFPADNLGADYIKAMLSSMNHLKLVATGGIDEGNMLEFLDSGCVGLGIRRKSSEPEAGRSRRLSGDF